MSEQGFRECKVCASAAGSPTLCESCLHNRKVIGRYEQRVMGGDEMERAACAIATTAHELKMRFVERKRHADRDGAAVVYRGKRVRMYVSLEYIEPEVLGR